ncbi:hypothetical protein GALMADRAFT_1364485 [Galerina marginata CBS 339.88]|uniref:Fungal N-terminal domain-containing protein n=1 Tax=Galerina marginata (strain CBS 339.88) TaxID=685588 RepID=A0A067S6X9_GALM3|nr:hypothetical protein GALMADRAFT_1364485 [Galerina marginata CBS 339.88]
MKFQVVFATLTSLVALTSAISVVDNVKFDIRAISAKFADINVQLNKFGQYITYLNDYLSQALALLIMLELPGLTRDGQESVTRVWEFNAGDGEGIQTGSTGTSPSLTVAGRKVVDGDIDIPESLESEAEAGKEKGSSALRDLVHARFRHIPHL